MAATVTAQIVVGDSMNYWGGPNVGIGPVRIMYLVEGSRAGWVLEPVAHVEPGEPITWVASHPERILVDGLVMIAALIDKEDPTVRNMIKDRLKPEQAQTLLKDRWADMTQLPRGALEQIETAATETVRSKLVVTVMSGSSLTGQVALLGQCSMDAEVCTASWIRERDPEGGETQVAGELPPDDPEGHRFYAVRI